MKVPNAILCSGCEQKPNLTWFAFVFTDSSRVRVCVCMFVFLSICTVKCKSCDRFAVTVLFFFSTFRFAKIHFYKIHRNAHFPFPWTVYLFCILKLVNIIVAAHIRVVFSFDSFLKLCTKIKDFVVEILFTPLNRNLCSRCRMCVYVAWPIICYFPRNWNQQGGKYTKYLYIL